MPTPHHFVFHGEVSPEEDLTQPHASHARPTNRMSNAWLSAGFSVLAGLGALWSHSLILGLLAFGWAIQANYTFSQRRRGHADGAGLHLPDRTIPWEQVTEIQLTRLRWPPRLLRGETVDWSDGLGTSVSAFALVVSTQDGRFGLWVDDEEDGETLLDALLPWVGALSGTEADVPDELRDLATEHPERPPRDLA